MNSYVCTISDFSTFVFRTRISTAMEMFVLHEQLREEQETYGPFGSFKLEMSDHFEQFGYTVYFSPEFFKGYSDIIFELTMTVTGEGGSVPLNSEQVIGTAITELRKQLDIQGYQSLRLDTEDHCSGKYSKLTCWT